MVRMLRMLSFLLLLSFFYTAAFAGGSDGAPDIYTPSEKKRLTSTKSLNTRVKVYDKAFERIRKRFEKDMREDRFGDAAGTLANWSALLKESLADITANVSAKKKPGRLKKYEIHVRQAIYGLRDFRSRAPGDLHDALGIFADQAEDVRRKFVDIFFNLVDKPPRNAL